MLGPNAVLSVFFGGIIIEVSSREYFVEIYIFSIILVY
jgi:hypothetical protein